MALTKISSNEIQPAAITSDLISADVSLGVKISNVSIANSSYTILDDTAVDTAGGYIVITGAGFNSGAQVIIGGTNATSVTRVSSTELRAQVPAKSAATYNVYVVNTDGSTGIRVNGLTYSGLPTWVTGSTLDNWAVDVATNVTFDATGAVSYANTTALPAGTTLLSNGYFYGTVTGIAEETTYSFTVQATDAENQDSPRTFSVTVTVGPSATLLLNFNDNLTNDGDPSLSMIQGGTAISFNSVNKKYGTHSGSFTTAAGARTSSTLAFGTGNWTIEGWFYPTALGNSVGQAWSQGINTTNGLLGGVFTTGVRFRSAGTTDIANEGLSLGNSWHHIAWVRTGNTIKIYVDGIERASGTYSNSMTDSNYTFSVGPNSAYTGANEAFNFAGLMDDFRIVLGEALYTSNFTPPAAEL